MVYNKELRGNNVYLRSICEEDCNSRYLEWLSDHEVNRYLETRWEVQTLEKISTFVEGIKASTDSYIFAIMAKDGTNEFQHIGNIKIGPINFRYSFADVSYFIGNKQMWGRGFATEAIRLITDFGFSQLGLYRMQAGVFERNLGSRIALERNGYKLEGCLRKQIYSNEGLEDHMLFGILKEEWENESTGK